MCGNRSQKLSLETNPSQWKLKVNHYTKTLGNTMMGVPVLFILITGFMVGGGEPTIGRYVTFVRNLFVAPQNLKYSNEIIFDRNQGEVNRELFKRNYGTEGEILVDAYGKGLSKKQLQDLGYL